MSKLWSYDSEWLTLWNEGLIQADENQIVLDYLLDLDVKDYVFLQNEKTKEIMWHLNSKRGNDTYARGWDERLSIVCDGLTNKVWDFPAEPQPDFIPGRKYRDTFVLLMTCTIHDDVMPRLKAWYNISDMLHRFVTRANQSLKEYLGEGCVTFTVKEGTERGYPAPHIVMVTTKPITVVYHYSKKEQGWKWITKDPNINAILHAIWYDISQSPVFDVRGVCQGDTGDSGTIVHYLTKYLGKSVNPNNKTAVYTHAFQKLFRLRDQVGRKFLDRLEVGLPQRYKARLDSYYNELQRLKRIRKVTALINIAFSRFDMLITIERDLYCGLQYYNEKIDDILAQIPPPEWSYLDHVRVRNNKDMQNLIDRILAVDKHNQSIRAEV